MYARMLFNDFRQGLASELRNFSLTSQQARASWGAALAATTAVLLADWLNFGHPYWAGITALVVSRTTYAASLAKGSLRVLGTATGCVLALPVVGLCIDSSFAVLCLIFFTAVSTIIIIFSRGNDGYAWSMGGFIIVLVSISGLTAPNGVFDFAIYRTLEISLGSIVAVSMSAIVNPAPSSEAALTHLVTAWSSLAEALRLGGAAWAEKQSDTTRIQECKRRMEKSLAKLPGLLFEGRVEGGLRPEQTTLLANFGRLTAYHGKRLFLLLEQRPALSGGYAALFEKEINAVASALENIAPALASDSSKLAPTTLLTDSAKALEEAVQALSARHHLLVEQGKTKDRPGEEMLAWNEVLRLAHDLARLFNELASGALSANQPHEKLPLMESMVVKQAVSLGLAVVLVPLIWKWLDLPGALQIGVTSIILLQPDPLETWRKGLLRLSGCITGGTVGLLLLGTPLGHFLWTWIATYFVLIFLFSYINHGDSRCSYIGLQAGIALTVTLVQGLGPSESLEPPLTRLCGILAGFFLWNVIHTLLGGYSPLRDLKNQVQGLFAALAASMAAPDGKEGAQETQRKTALAQAAARLKAAHHAQDILIWQGFLKSEDVLLLEEALTDLDRLMDEAPKALAGGEPPGPHAPPGVAEAEKLLADPALRLPRLRQEVQKALQAAQAGKNTPWSELDATLANIRQDFENDVTHARSVVNERKLSPETRMETAATLMALKGMLEALASLARKAAPLQAILAQGTRA